MARWRSLGARGIRFEPSGAPGDPSVVEIRKFGVDLGWGVRAPAPTCAAMESKLEVTMCKNRRSALRPLPNIRDQGRDGFGNSGARFSRRQVFYFHRRGAVPRGGDRGVLQIFGRRGGEKKRPPPQRPQQ